MISSTIINPKGSWGFWTNKQQQELAEAANNTSVGEKLVFENDEFKLWSIHLAAGQKLPFHKHALRYFWTALTSGESRSYYSDGSVRQTKYQKGDTAYFADVSSNHFFIHNLENIGETELIFSTVEFLK
ncbi:hypothetical protein [Flavobacterium sp. FlaQc-48]|uniref:hypothetical protein n=1 Tax=Flavobacterium sp. FlaQc-48 TaxID=3374181 RepID=UPI003757FCD3